MMLYIPNVIIATVFQPLILKVTLSISDAADVCEILYLVHEKFGIVLMSFPY